MSGRHRRPELQPLTADDLQIRIETLTAYGPEEWRAYDRHGWVHRITPPDRVETDKETPQ